MTEKTGQSSISRDKVSLQDSSPRFTDDDLLPPAGHPLIYTSTLPLPRPTSLQSEQKKHFYHSPKHARPLTFHSLTQTRDFYTCFSLHGPNICSKCVTRDRDRVLTGPLGRRHTPQGPPAAQRHLNTKKISSWPPITRTHRSHSLFSPSSS